MGQLEKYGLYVLCLVIFLILGVAIWGEPEPALAERGRLGALPEQQRASPAAIDLSGLMTPVPKPSTGTVPDRRNGGRSNPDAGPGGAADRTALDKTAPDAGDGQPKAKETPDAGDHAAKGEARPTPAPAARPTHTIRSGDTFDGIARQKLGDVRFVGLLRELNPGVHPERLQLGQQIALPTTAELAALGPTGSGKESAKATEPPAERERAGDRSDRAGSGASSVGSSRVDLQACKLEYSIVSPK